MEKRRTKNRLALLEARTDVGRGIWYQYPVDEADAGDRSLWGCSLCKAQLCPKKNQSLLWFPTPCLEISWTPLKHPTKKEQKVSVCGQNLIGDLFIQDKSREMITPETESVETKAQVVET